MDAAGRGRPRCGGIVSLARELDDDPDFRVAVEADLIDKGLRLRWLCDGTDRLNWADLFSVIRSAGPGSSLAFHAHGEASAWGFQEELLASIADLLAGANWQRGGGKGMRPKPLDRPWQEKSRGSSSPFGDGFENDALTIEEMDAWLALPAT